MWKAGAILELDEEQGSAGGYSTILEDVWDAVPLGGEYISTQIIEHPDNAKFFERVYETTHETYITKDEVIKIHQEDFKL